MDERRKRRARRDRIEDATDFMGWYMDGTTRRLGIPKWDATNQYLAYHEGRTGYSRGSHNAKPWLLAVAQRVGDREQRYRAQLTSLPPLTENWARDAPAPRLWGGSGEALSGCAWPLRTGC